MNTVAKADREFAFDDIIKGGQPSLIETSEDMITNEIALISTLEDFVSRANDILKDKLKWNVFDDFCKMCLDIEQNRLVVNEKIISLLNDCYQVLDNHYSEEIYEEDLWKYSKIRIEKISATQRN